MIVVGLVWPLDIVAALGAAVIGLVVLPKIAVTSWRISGEVREFQLRSEALENLVARNDANLTMLRERLEADLGRLDVAVDRQSTIGAQRIERLQGRFDRKLERSEAAARLLSAEVSFQLAALHELARIRDAE